MPLNPPFREEMMPPYNRRFRESNTRCEYRTSVNYGHPNLPFNDELAALLIDYYSRGLTDWFRSTNVGSSVTSRPISSQPCWPVQSTRVVPVPPGFERRKKQNNDVELNQSTEALCLDVAQWAISDPEPEVSSDVGTALNSSTAVVKGQTDPGRPRSMSRDDGKVSNDVADLLTIGTPVENFLVPQPVNWPTNLYKCHGLWIEDIDFDCSRDVIKRHFERFGTYHRLDVSVDHVNRRAFIIYDNPEAPTLALAVLSRYKRLEGVYSTPTDTTTPRVHFHPSDEQSKSGLKIQPNAKLENECFDWRTVGCKKEGCYFLHKEQSLGVDKQPSHRPVRR